MKKTIYIFMFSIFFANVCSANDVFKNVLISEEVESESIADKATKDAINLLKSDLKPIKIEGLPKTGPRVQAPVLQLEENLKKYGEAPFGLQWGTSSDDIRKSGTVISSNSNKIDNFQYTASLLPKNLFDFDKYILDFGKENKLWNITAYRKPINDDASASLALKEFNKFSDLLETKYGNKKEIFTPKISFIEEEIESKDDRGKPIKTKVKKEIATSIGGISFLEDLKNKESSLEVTFNNEQVAVILILAVDNSGKSYIILDYRSLELIKEQEEKILDTL